MQVLLTTTFALILWIVLWAIDFKAFDGLLIALSIVVVSISLQALGKHLPSRHGQDG